MYIKVEIHLQKYNMHLNIAAWMTLIIMTKIKPVEPSNKKRQENVYKKKKSYEY